MELETTTTLKRALQQAIAFHRVLATVGGCATAGLFLTRCWYWTTTTVDLDGWWTKTQAEWEIETALTRREQERIRRRLRMSGILEEKKMGVLAKLYFRLNLGTLARLIDESANN